MQKKLRQQALGAELARVRKHQGMPTQKDLEARSGVSTRTISDIENARIVPRVQTMRKLEVALGLPPGQTDDFLDGQIRRLQPESTVDELAPTDELEELIVSHPDLTRKDKLEKLRKYRERRGYEPPSNEGGGGVTDTGT